MRRAIACLVAIAGCGRIAFDVHGDAVVDGAADGAADVTADVSHIACTPFEIDIPVDNVTGEASSVWTGTGYWTLAYRAGNQYLVSLSDSGVEGAMVDVGQGIIHGQMLAWTGSVVGVLATNADQLVRFRTFDPTTKAVGPEIVVNATAPADLAVLLWAGDRFEVVWAFGSSVNERALAADGSFLTPERRISTTAGGIESLAASPTTIVACAGLLDGTGKVIAIDRMSSMVQELPLDIGMGGGCEVVVRADGTFGATLEDGQMPKLQWLDTSGVPQGAGAAFTGTAASQQHVLFPTASGVRVIIHNGSGLPTHTINALDISAAGSVGSLMPFTTVDMTGWSPPAGVIRPGGSLYVLPYVTATSTIFLRAIQRCN